MRKTVYIGDGYNPQTNMSRKLLTFHPGFQSGRHVVQDIVDNVDPNEGILLWLAAIDLAENGETYESFVRKFAKYDDAIDMLLSLGKSPADNVYFNPNYSATALWETCPVQGIPINARKLRNILFNSVLQKFALTIFRDGNSILWNATICKPEPGIITFQFGELCSYDKRPLYPTFQFIMPTDRLRTQKSAEPWMKQLEEGIKKRFGNNLTVYRSALPTMR